MPRHEAAWSSEEDVESRIGSFVTEGEAVTALETPTLAAGKPAIVDGLARDWEGTQP
jgi:hypothetical protein